MNLWCELAVIGLLWAGVIAGLICVVRDCMKDRHLEPTLPNPGVDDRQSCCGLDGLEILGCHREQS